MKVFHCDHCSHMVFFDSVSCVRCGHVLAFLPKLGVIGSLDHVGDGVYTTPIPRAEGTTFRLCQNYATHNVCNWAVRADDDNALCRSCRTTDVIPDLTVPGNLEAWQKLEAAKRRLAYTLQALRVPLDGLSFKFLADDPVTGRVLTGHANGLITVNIAEADDVERERRKKNMREPYRTLLGHFRHESGHFYFDKLIAPNAERLTKFREMFGDERQDYAAALKHHYDHGPEADWSQRCISAYASVHPWEDWAETWAHYLHMMDALETGAACGIGLFPDRPEKPAAATVPDPVTSRGLPFDSLLDGWYALTYMLNNLNRSMGLPDAYPFVIPTPTLCKLRFIHDVVTPRRRLLRRGRLALR